MSRTEMTMDGKPVLVITPSQRSARAFHDAFVAAKGDESTRRVAALPTGSGKTCSARAFTEPFVAAVRSMGIKLGGWAASDLKSAFAAIRRDIIAAARMVAQAEQRRLTLRRQARIKGRPGWKRGGLAP